MSRHFAYLMYFSDAYLGVSIIDVDVNCDHEENSDGDTKVSNQTTDLKKIKSKTTRQHSDCA